MDKATVGYLLMLTNGRRIFVESSKWPGFADGKMTIPGDGAYEIIYTQVGAQNFALVCDTLINGPFKASSITIYKATVSTIEALTEDSIAWKAVSKNKSNLVIPKSPILPPGFREVK